MSHSLLALDLALNAGYSQWAVNAPKPNAGLLKIDPALSLGERLGSVYKWTLRKIVEWSITDISIEEPFVGGFTPGAASQFHWLISAYGVVCMAATQCKTNGVPVNVVPIANATMAVHWLGSRDIEKKNRKTYSILEAQRRGLGEMIMIKGKNGQVAPDHNTADSFGVMSTRLAQLGMCHLTPWDSKRSPGPLFTGLTGKPAGTTITKSNKIAAAKILNAAGSFERDSDGSK